jgi:hypothetical protein
MASNISTLATNKYSAGYSAGYAAGDIKHSCYVQLNVSCHAHGMQYLTATLYVDGTSAATSSQTYGDIQASDFGTTTNSSTVSV